MFNRRTDRPALRRLVTWTWTHNLSETSDSNRGVKVETTDCDIYPPIRGEQKTIPLRVRCITAFCFTEVGFLGGTRISSLHNNIPQQSSIARRTFGKQTAIASVKICGQESTPNLCINRSRCVRHWRGLWFENYQGPAAGRIKCFKLGVRYSTGRMSGAARSHAYILLHAGHILFLVPAVVRMRVWLADKIGNT